MQLVAKGVEHEAGARVVDLTKLVVSRDDPWFGHAQVVDEDRQGLTA
jgi:hypothetical protein